MSGKIRHAPSLRYYLTTVVILALLLSHQPAIAGNEVPTDTIQSLQRQLEQAGATLHRATDTGQLRFISTPHGKPLPLTAPGKMASAEAQHLVRLAPLFGINDPDRQLTISRSQSAEDGRRTVRYQQHHAGLPIIGAELIMNLTANGSLLSLNGRSSEVRSVETTPRTTESETIATALSAVAKWHRSDRHRLVATPPKLAIYDPPLLHPGRVPPKLVWQLEIRSTGLDPIREYLLVDATTGRITLHFNRSEPIKNRQTYSSNHTAGYEVTLVCDESDGDSCSGGSDNDADAAHLHAGDAYDFFFNHHGRDGIDDAGMVLLSNVDWDNGTDCPNAFWDGSRMVYCDTLPLADDIVAHELTHGVTEHTSNLYYYYQSGAINESLSDIWGEFIDLENGRQTDTDSVRWEMGEDAVAFGGAIRNMKLPTLYGHPDKMSSLHYYTGPLDNGGVHTNSGVGNKAAYLMTDGDTFNGYSITGLGIAKVSAIYYLAQTKLLTSGSDYADLHYALYQSCQTLIGGSEGITASDCEEVRKATLAVEMDRQPEAGFNPEAGRCPSGATETATLFSDNLESGPGNWRVTAAIDGGTTWYYATGYAKSDENMLWGNMLDDLSDESIELLNAISLPSGKASYLHFDHAFDIEAPDWDGALIEYSLDGGSNWSDAGHLIDAGKGYTGKINDTWDNPAAGSDAFIGSSHGYVSSRLNLTGLAGKPFHLRFRTATDSSVASPIGWVVDNVSVYTCNRPPVANAGPDTTTTWGATHTLIGSSSTDPDSGDTLDYQWSQLSGTTVTLSDSSSVSPSFTVPAIDEVLRFELLVTDGFGATSRDTVDITISESAPPPSSSGGGGGGGAPSPYLLLLGLLLWAVRWNLRKEMA